MFEIARNRDIRNGQAFTNQMGFAHQCGTKTGQVQLFQSMVAEAYRAYCSAVAATPIVTTHFGPSLIV
jgi:hypothetical protein